MKRQILMRPSSGVSICLLRQATGDSPGGRQVCVRVRVCTENTRGGLEIRKGSEGRVHTQRYTQQVVPLHTWRRVSGVEELTSMSFLCSHNHRANYFG